MLHIVGLKATEKRFCYFDRDNEENQDRNQIGPLSFVLSLIKLEHSIQRKRNSHERGVQYNKSKTLKATNDEQTCQTLDCKCIA